MIVMTDNIAYANDLFDEALEWKRYHPADAHPGLTKLRSALFSADVLFTTGLNAHPLWEYLLIVEYAPGSQFKALTQLFDREEGVSGIACLAGSGDNFKGQRDRLWQSLRGNIHLSAFLKPDCAIAHPHIGFTIVSAVSVVQTLDEIGLKDRVSIKWVNDILIDQSKVAGVLTQTQMQGEIVKGVFIGIGVNVEKTPDLGPEPPGLRPISVRAALQREGVSLLPAVLKSLMAHLADNYVYVLDGRYRDILDTYKSRSIVVGKKVAVYSDPVGNEPELIDEGIVTAIGDNLELYLEHKKEPVIRGRIAVL